MNDAAFLSREYNNRVLVKDHPQYLARWAEASARARATMTCYLDRRYGDEPGEAKRSTDATVYSVVEGSGRARIGEAVFDFEPKDTFVVPSWQPLRLEASPECVLFSFSDRPAQLALGIWRESRG